MERKLGILWLRFLNEISQLSEIPTEFIDSPEIAKAIELTQEASYTKEKLAEYDGYWDQISIAKTIQYDALKKGREEGEAIGLEKGREEGELKAKYAMARNLLSLCVLDDVILSASGLTRDELNALKQSE